MNIPLTKPAFDEKELEAITKPLKTGWVVEGPYVKEFEEKILSYTDMNQAIATSSCTAALHMGVTALDLQPGDEVIVPAFTWIATANVVKYMGATPVFCDIDLATFNIDPSKIEQCITPKTVGIIPVHLFGLCADMESILEIAEANTLWVLEDAACALGSFYQGKHAGQFGTLGCFSFHPRKTITTGEGGMIVTNDEELADRLQRMRNHGACRSSLERFTDADACMADHDILGYNYRMTDIQGALGSAQMEKLPWIIEERKKRAENYDQALSSMHWLRTPFTPPDTQHGYQSYVTLFSPEEPTIDSVGHLHIQRNALMRQLATEGIATSQGTHAVPFLTYYQKQYGYTSKDFPNAYLADRLSLTLPLYPQMLKDEQDTVFTKMNEAYVHVQDCQPHRCEEPHLS